MKRILALVLACVIAVNMGAVAYCFEPGDDYEYGPDANESTGYTTEDGWGGSVVSSTIGMVLTATCTITPTYSVTVTWDSMAFTYEGDGTGDWNPEDHAYEGGGGTWTGGSTENGDGSCSSTITITNDSSVAVSVSCEYEAAPGSNYQEGTAYNGVTVTLDGPDKDTLEAGTEGTDGDSTTATVSVSGDPEESINAVVGTITITIDSAY